MIQIRLHGRGGQGVVTAAELLASAAFKDGKAAQAFPSFGSERTGAPVMAFCRLHSQPIRTREPVWNPDVLLIHDSTLLHHVDVFGGLSPQGVVIINTTRDVDRLGLAEWRHQMPKVQIYTLPASEIAMKHLGRPLANIAMIAGFSALTDTITPGSLDSAIQEKFPGSIQDMNRAVALEAYDTISRLISESSPHIGQV